jgi:hypothetical protein
MLEVSVSPVDELDSAWREPMAGEVPAKPDQASHEEFDLMAITVPSNPNVFEGDRYVAGLSISDVNPFVVDLAVPRQAAKRVAKQIGGGLHIVQEAEFPQVDLLGEMDSEKRVIECRGRQIQEFDLLRHGYAGARVLELFGSHSTAPEDGCGVHAGTLGLGICNSTDSPGGGGKRVSAAFFANSDGSKLGTRDHAIGTNSQASARWMFYLEDRNDPLLGRLINMIDRCG